MSDWPWPKAASNYKVSWIPRWFRADQAYVWYNVPWLHFPIVKIDVADEAECIEIVERLAAGESLEDVIRKGVNDG